MVLEYIGNLLTGSWSGKFKQYSVYHVQMRTGDFQELLISSSSENCVIGFAYYRQTYRGKKVWKSKDWFPTDWLKSEGCHLVHLLTFLNFEHTFPQKDHLLSWKIT